MRITFLTQWFEPEPPRIQLPLARALVERGFDVEVVTGFPNYPSGKLYPGYELKTWQRETISGVPVLRVPLYPSHDRNPLRRAANYASFAVSAATLGPLLARRSDAMFVYHPPPTIGGVAAVFRRAWGNLPVLYHVEDMWPESAIESGMFGDGRVKEISSAILSAYCKWVYSECDLISVLSPGFITLLAERGVDPAKMHVVYNWVDEDVFRPVARDEGLAAALGMSGRFNVVYAGNMGPYQGLEVVLEGAALLRDHPDIQIVLAGTGTEEARLRARAVELRVDNVRFLPHRPAAEMPSINALADVLLVHLRDFSFFRVTVPGKTQVALASGRPILMAVAGEAAEIVRRADAGVTVPPEDPAALARAIVRLRDLPADERARMGERGRAYYTREMSLDVGADRIAALLRGLGERRQTRGQRSSYAPVVR